MLATALLLLLLDAPPPPPPPPVCTEAAQCTEDPPFIVDPLWCNPVCPIVITCDESNVCVVLIACPPCFCTP